MPLTSRDLQFLSQALELARRGVGCVSPGALVGAVVVKNGRVVGEGFYRYEQQTHAEVIALERAGRRSQGATLYLNLEPCSHYGRTPPCSDFVISCGIRRVVCSMPDPNPQVAGKGIRKLRAAGIHVDVGGLEFEARQLNEAFIKFITQRTPFVTLKAAMTLDGKIAASNQPRGSVTWITSELSRERVHVMRHAHDAILVGVNTILMDDPLLTDRSSRPRRRPLLRVVLDSRLRTPLHSKFVRSSSNDVLILCGREAPVGKRLALEKQGVEVTEWKNSKPYAGLSSSPSERWNAILRELTRREIQSVLVEGGGETNWSAMRAGVVDKFCFFVAPIILGGKGHVPVFGGSGFPAMNKSLQLFDVSIETIDRDILITGYPGLLKKFSPKTRRSTSTQVKSR